MNYGVATEFNGSSQFKVSCPVCEQPMKHAKWGPVLFEGKPADAILVCEPCHVEATCRPASYVNKHKRQGAPVLDADLAA
jgi:hypothetical protein